MGEKSTGWLKNLDGLQKVLGILAILLMALNILLGDHYQVEAATKKMHELEQAQEQYAKVISRVDRRLYRLELAHKIATEPAGE